MYEYAKVILYAYPKLEATAEAVEQGARNKAALSYRGREGALTAAEEIAEEFLLSARMRRLAATVRDMLAGFSAEERFLLEYKYFRRKKVLRKWGKACGLTYSERSYYRKQEELFLRICVYFAACGITEHTFGERYGDFPCFMKCWQALKKGYAPAVTGKRRARGIAFQKSDCSSVCSVRGFFLPRATKNAIATAAAHATQMTTICTAESPAVPAGSVTGSGR